MKDIIDCRNANSVEYKKTKKKNTELENYLRDKNNEKCEMETKQTIENYVKLNRKYSFTNLIKCSRPALSEKEFHLILLKSSTIN